MGLDHSIKVHVPQIMLPKLGVKVTGLIRVYGLQSASDCEAES